MSPEEFTKLRDFWYQRLKDEGFEDCEKFSKNGLLVLKDQTTQIFKLSESQTEAKGHFLKWLAKQAYYEIIYPIAIDADTAYRDYIDRHIMVRHAEGAMIKTIVNELRIMKMPRERTTVRIIIRRYEKKWGIRNYSPKQLREKKNQNIYKKRKKGFWNG